MFFENLKFPKNEEGGRHPNWNLNVVGPITTCVNDHFEKNKKRIWWNPNNIFEILKHFDGREI